MLRRMICSDKPMDEYRVTKCQQAKELSPRNSTAIIWQRTKTRHAVRISSVIVSDIKEQP